VNRLSFGQGVLVGREQLDRRIQDLLRIHCDAVGVSTSPGLKVAAQFGNLIRKVHAATTERVVVLVDAYDKPILDTITDPVIAREMPDGLRNLCAISIRWLRVRTLTSDSPF
jgi:hypothetical protein